MFQIDLLKNYPDHITRLSQIWYDVLGSVWLRGVSATDTALRLRKHLNDDCLPLTYVAFQEGNPLGMASLRENDGIWPYHKPWLGSLVVDRAHQKQGIGRTLIDQIKFKTRDMGYPKLYLYSIDPRTLAWYASLGWTSVGEEPFREHRVTIMQIDV